MAEFYSHGNFPNFSIFQDFFSDITANERFLTLCLPTWEAKSKTKTPPRVEKLAECFHSGRCSVTKRKSLEDIPRHELDAAFAFLSLQIQGNNLKRSQGYGKRKNPSRALSEADE